MVALIRGGVAGPGGTWTDLGAGTGNFSWALAALLGPQATIHAIDRDAKAIRQIQQRLAQDAPEAAIVPQQADITRPLDLPALDGVLMANALHFIRDQPAMLALAAGYLPLQDGETQRGRFVYLRHPASPDQIVEFTEATPARRAFNEAIERAGRGWDGSDPVRPFSAAG